MIITGNDVASYQGDIDYNRYKDNTNFVIIKATEGIGYIDPKFSRNQSESRRTGILLGYYHFARPDLGNSAELEAQFFLTKLGELKEGETLYLDYECANQVQAHVTWCRKWLDYVQSKTGVKAMIYLNQSQVKKFNWKEVIDGGYGLWIAAYTYDPNKNDFEKGQWPFAAMQQWTNQQKVPGILNGTGNVDGNVFFGDKTALKKYGYKAPTPPPPSTDWEKKYNDEHTAFEDYKRRYNQETQDRAVSTAIQSLNERIDRAQVG